MSGALLVSIAALALAEPGGRFDPQAKLSGQQQDCKAAPKNSEEVVVCGRRESPYRIDKGVLATMPPDPQQQRRRDTGQAALNRPYCPPAGPNACDLSAKVEVPIIPMILKAITIISGTPARDVLRTSPDQYKVYERARDSSSKARVSPGIPTRRGTEPPR